MENTTFKNSLFGGFNRQDVIDYIESASRKSSETIAALEAEAGREAAPEVCPTCGAEKKDGAAFCGECGGPL